SHPPDWMASTAYGPVAAAGKARLFSRRTMTFGAIARSRGHTCDDRGKKSSGSLKREASAMRSYGLLALMTAALVNGPPEAASAGSKVDRHGSVQGNPRAFTAGIDTVAAYAKETPHGDFNVENRYGGSISPAKEMPGSNKVGATEGRTMCIPHAPDKAPLPETLGLPFLPFKKFDVQRTVHEAVSLP